MFLMSAISTKNLAHGLYVESIIEILIPKVLWAAMHMRFSANMKAETDWLYYACQYEGVKIACFSGGASCV